MDDKLVNGCGKITKNGKNCEFSRKIHHFFHLNLILGI